jgi:flagellar basal-body rod modification protein FlgD
MTSVTGTAAPRTGAQAAAKPAGSMDQNDFLRLMTTQLTTQDPFNPMDGTQMVAQMAQFSQVAGIAEINQSLKAMAAGMAPGRLNDAASWIGRSVLAESDVAAPLADGSYGGEMALTSAVEELSVSYVAADGSVVHTQNLGPKPAGAQAFSWDGKNAAGATIATGPLKVVVSARAGDKLLEPATATWTTVRGIQSPANGSSTLLLTGLGALAPDAALRLA